MDILDDMRQQYAVYWPPLGVDDFSAVTYGPPVELRVRWEETFEITIDAQGRELRSKGKCYTAEDLEVEGYLWPGTLEEGVLAQVPEEALTDPKILFKAWRIAKFEKIPTLDNDDVYRCAWM